MDRSDQTFHEEFGDFRDIRVWRQSLSELTQWEGELNERREMHKAAGTDWRDEPELWELSDRVQRLKNAVESAAPSVAAQHAAQERAQAAQASASAALDPAVPLRSVGRGGPGSAGGSGGIRTADDPCHQPTFKNLNNPENWAKFLAHIAEQDREFNRSRHMFETNGADWRNDPMLSLLGRQIDAMKDQRSRVEQLRQTGQAAGLRFSEMAAQSARVTAGQAGVDQVAAAGLRHSGPSGAPRAGGRSHRLPPAHGGAGSAPQQGGSGRTL
ncbi:hypothetical protein ABT336_20640 [Micromonospora sp. NPDC000207]|uniref:hypothetical protein n=1 Tax=Micromonospora sp. NPDC000207 TaxID=3154246 RepID=UPI003331AADC